MRLITQQTAYINSVSFFANASPTADGSGFLSSYGNVRHNTGQYDNSTGIFTVPVKGYYFIGAASRTEGNGQLFAVINGSDDVGNDGDGDGSSATDGPSFSCIRYLDRGDQIRLQLQGSQVGSTPRHFFTMMYLGA